MITRNDVTATGIAQLAIIDEYVAGVAHALERISRQQISDAVDVLFDCWQHAGCVYIVGNGGSAATASHMMNDLIRGTWREGTASVRAMALTDNVPLMTAIGNDTQYDRIFSDLLEALWKPHDVLVAISTSGNSPNVLNAVATAQRRALRVIGLCGKKASHLSVLADVVVTVPAELIGQQEDGHMVVNHAIALALRRRIESHPAGTNP
ncbi:MAG TPA: SIS domain-containing protein [Candidatus Eremiobacteraceae bacterium]|nr:SIS domain-containing protein [Candidatus Eremiobacteraceae bacterium]